MKRRRLGSKRLVGWLMLVCMLLLSVAIAFGEAGDAAGAEAPAAAVETTEATAEDGAPVEEAPAEEAVGEEAPAEHVSNMYDTFWALVPPIVAIVLALITKEVYTSLFIGILCGALFYANFNLELTLTTMINDGFIASLADSSNVGILIFLVILGAMVQMINKAGGLRRVGGQENQDQDERAAGDVRPGRADFRGRLLQLPDGRFRHAADYGPAPDFPRKAVVSD